MRRKRGHDKHGQPLHPFLPESERHKVNKAVLRAFKKREWKERLDKRLTRRRIGKQIKQQLFYCWYRIPSTLFEIRKDPPIEIVEIVLPLRTEKQKSLDDYPSPEWRVLARLREIPATTLLNDLFMLTLGESGRNDPNRPIEAIL